MTHTCVSKLYIIGSDNGLSPGRCQAIIWINDWILLFGSLGTNFNEIWIEIYTFSFKKIHLKMSSGKWRPSCLSLSVLTWVALDTIWPLLCPYWHEYILYDKALCYHRMGVSLSRFWLDGVPQGSVLNMGRHRMFGTAWCQTYCVQKVMKEQAIYMVDTRRLLRNIEGSLWNMTYLINLLGPCNTIWRQRSRSTLTQVMACCLMAPSHYLNQCWLMISEVLWHSPDSNLTEYTSVVEMSLKFINLRL